MESDPRKLDKTGTHWQVDWPHVLVQDLTSCDLESHLDCFTLQPPVSGSVYQVDNGARW